MKSPPETVGLNRGLTLIPAMAIILANVIGTGVFVKARVMTCNVGEPGLVMAAYVLGGVLMLCGALAYAELSTMMPHAGGAMNYLRAAYGRRWGFLYGWMEFVAGTSAASAAVAILFVVFLNDVVGGALSPLAQRLLPLAVIAVVTGLNLFPVRHSGHLTTALTAVKVALVLGIGVAAFVWGDGSWGHFGASGAAAACADVPASARFGLAGFGAAMVGALWSYQGWDQLVLVAGEVRRPSWTLPRALVGAAVLIAALYLFVNAAYFYVLAPEAVAGVSPESSVAREVMVRLLGAGVASALAAGLMLSSFGTLYTGVLVVPRVTYALAQDGLLPAAFARVSPATRIPRTGVLAFGAWCMVLTASGTFEILSDVSVVALLSFLGLAVSAVFRLRRTHPDAERPVRAWGYPVVPGLYLLGVVLLIGNTFVATPGRALAGFGLIALGLPVYAYYARKQPLAVSVDGLASAEPPVPVAETPAGALV
jgi:APA family basic amino acid/polyamine antiporter